MERLRRRQKKELTEQLEQQNKERYDLEIVGKETELGMHPKCLKQDRPGSSISPPRTECIRATYKN